MHPFDHLFAQILSRKTADPSQSYTAKLLVEGTAKCAKKVGEEAVEVAIACLGSTYKEKVEESADLLYHLCVLWASSGVRPEDVYAELAAREGRSGLDSKAARKGIVK
jgi:phosphoribosyl-ATP pyrophosphohydrolase